MSEEKNTSGFNRRDVLKGLATLPVLGLFGMGLWAKKRYERNERQRLMQNWDMDLSEPGYEPLGGKGKEIRIGIIGYGIRGNQLARAAGFVHPSWVDDEQKKTDELPGYSRLTDFLAQDNLNIRVTGVCDVFSVRAKMAQEAGANINRKGTGGQMGDMPTIYNTYQELLAADDIDAVIIASPDHWHAPMAIDAVKAGKHVYVEKPLSHKLDETKELRDLVHETGMVLQLGHQGRQVDSHNKARQAVEKGLLGKITLVELTTNRNDPNGAWVYDIHPDASPETIDWQQFLGNAPQVPFNKEHFFRWRCWWAYSNGLIGDLLTHEYDAVNQVMDLGIPASAVSSGGVYFFKDGRDVPDVHQVVYEYPEKDLTMLYSATLGSQKTRNRTFMGHDGYMELDNSIAIWADPRSTKYADKLKSGEIDPYTPIFSYVPGKNDVDAHSSATERYFATRGLFQTYRGGRRLDTTHLHIREWLECIRDGGTPSCNIDVAFEEGIAALMGGMAYKQKAMVHWDPENEEIVIGTKATEAQMAVNT